MTVAIQNLAPALTTVFRQEYPPSISMLTRSACPGREIKTIRVLRIDSQAIRRICPLRQGHRAPMLSTVSRPIDGPVTIGSDAAILRASSDPQIKHSFVISNNPPGKRVLLQDASVLQLPTLPAVPALVNAAAKPRHVENAFVDRTGRIHQNVRCCGLLHPIVGFDPRLAAILALANASPVFCDSPMAPHLRPWQVVRAAIYTPNRAFHSGIKHHPISRIQPVFRHAVRRTNPRLAAILAAKE